jgi:hypothetical protein
VPNTDWDWIDDALGMDGTEDQVLQGLIPYRPLKRLLFFIFSLQSSQYHFATCMSAAQSRI